MGWRKSAAGLNCPLLARGVVPGRVRDVLPGLRRVVLFQRQSRPEVAQFRRLALREEPGRRPHFVHLQP